MSGPMLVPMQGQFGWPLSDTFRTEFESHKGAMLEPIMELWGNFWNHYGTHIGAIGGTTLEAHFGATFGAIAEPCWNQFWNPLWGEDVKGASPSPVSGCAALGTSSRALL